MDAEAARVRSERGERRRTADVRDPRAGGDVRRRLADRPVGDAEEHELGIALVEREPALQQARSDGRADAAAADHIDTFDHAVSCSSSSWDTGLRSSVTNRRGPGSPGGLARRERR